MGKVIAKFGGSSVKDADAIKRVASIIRKRKPSLVVLSATYNTTNNLEEIAKADDLKQDQMLSDLHTRHLDMCEDLGIAKECEVYLKTLLNEAKNLCKEINLASMDQLYSIGERLSSRILFEYLKNLELPVELIDARQLIKTDSSFSKAEPLITEIKQSCHEFQKIFDKGIIVTQGFIGQTLEGETTTLGREGSDYTAALLAEGFGASSVEIWTDVAGIATFDPRKCSDFQYIDHLSYSQAAGLTMNGAKVLFPRTMSPVERLAIPLYVKSTFDPDKKGTCISHKKCQIKQNVAMAFLDNVLTIISNDTHQLINDISDYEIIESGEELVKIKCKEAELNRIHEVFILKKK